MSYNLYHLAHLGKGRKRTKRKTASKVSYGEARLEECFGLDLFVSMMKSFAREKVLKGLQNDGMQAVYTQTSPAECYNKGFFPRFLFIIILFITLLTLVCFQRDYMKLPYCI